jgi:acyl carrier protein
LDTVELIYRVEETFGVELPNEECEKIETVGDIYRLVLEKHGLPYIAGTEVERIDSSVPAGRDRSRVGSLIAEPWITPDVWITLKRVIEDQLQVNRDKIMESATLTYGLGCD